MRTEILAQLTNLPRLAAIDEIAGSPPCKICGSAAPLFDIVDFNKYCNMTKPYQYGVALIPVSYHRCEICGFIFTMFFDDWSSAEFERFIYNEDYVKVDPEYVRERPQRQAELIADILGDRRTARILDYGSGNGAFAARLREAGFTNVENYDPFSSPTRPRGVFDIVTCFEVLEHVLSPIATVQDMSALLSRNGLIIFGTGIQPPSIAEIRGSWWYMGPRNGHVSMYSEHALSLLGEHCGLALFRGRGVFAFVPDEQAPTVPGFLGRKLRFARFGSPSGTQSEAASSNWHDIEASHLGRFRWTRSQRIEWELASPPRQSCRLKVTIPFLLSIDAGFADGCRIEIGGVSPPTLVEGSALTATAEVETVFPCTIALLTPPPISPYDLRGAPDTRRLGLAIPVF